MSLMQLRIEEESAIDPVECLQIFLADIITSVCNVKGIPITVEQLKVAINFATGEFYNSMIESNTINISIDSAIEVATSNKVVSFPR